VPTVPPPSSRPFAAAAALLAAGAIAAATLTDGDPRALEDTGLTCLVCGSRGGVDVTLNLLLFLPLGAALAAAGWRGRAAVPAGAALSLAVETAQLTVLVGRDPSLSDLLANTAGTAIGWMLVRHARGWALPAPAAARRLAGAALAGWIAVLALTAAGVQPDVSRAVHTVNRIPPRSGFLRPFEGRVHGAWLDGRAVPPVGSAGAAADGPPLRGDALAASAVVEPADPPGMLRPLVVAHDEGWDELLVLGQRGRSLVFRLRTRSAAARFESPTLVLPGVFPAEGSAARPGAPVRLDGRATREALVLRAAADGSVRTAVFPRSPLVGWTFVTASFFPYGRWGDALTVLWTVALVLPGAYWARRAAAAGGGGPRRGSWRRRTPCRSWRCRRSWRSRIPRRTDGPGWRRGSRRGGRWADGRWESGTQGIRAGWDRPHHPTSTSPAAAPSSTPPLPPLRPQPRLQHVQVPERLRRPPSRPGASERVEDGAGADPPLPREDAAAGAPPPPAPATAPRPTAAPAPRTRACAPAPPGGRCAGARSPAAPP
jgi:hypothetical protein